MDYASSLSGIAILVTALAVLALVESLIPLRKPTQWSRFHLVPNLLLTLLTFAINMQLNIAMLLGLVWASSQGWGLFNNAGLPALIEIAGAIMALDLAWYVTHRLMHRYAGLWRLHTVHHSDPMVDVTTTIRQHPGETLFRFPILLVFALAFGVSPLGFAIYRVLSAVQGMIEHANIRLPAWLDAAYNLLFSSPNFHKLHHSRSQSQSDSNFGNIFSIWDRLFASFTHPSQGRAIDYGLDGYDEEAMQTFGGQLRLPFTGGPQLAG